MNSKTKALALLSVIILATVAGSLILISNAKADTNNTGTDTTTTAVTPEQTITANGNCPFAIDDRFGGPGFRGCPRGGMGHVHDFGGLGATQISDEYKANVTNIANADSDVQNLLAQGYNVTAIRPQMTTTVDANGNVVMKATSAYLILTKDTSGRAIVQVDLTNSQVTRIIIETRTVIQK
jgi:hypothetical protein